MQTPHHTTQIKVTRGAQKGRDGKIVACYRKKWAVHVDKITREKANGGAVQIPFHPSNVEIVRIKLDNDRKRLLERKDRSKHAKVQMKNVD